MVVKLILALFLALSCVALGVRIQVNGNLDFSYGFGYYTGLTFSQQFQFLVNGEIENGLYISSSIGTDTKWLTLYYVPLDLQIGNAIPSIYGNNLPIFGIKSPYFSFGQLIGKTMIVDVTVSPVNPSVTLTPMVYGSLSIYLNGYPLDPSRYSVDYTTGTIYFLDLSFPQTFTVEYQSALENSGAYLFLTKIGSTYDGYSINGIASTTFSTPSNQFFASVEAIGNERIRASLNFDTIPSFQIEFGKKFSNSNLDLRYTSEGFRYPMGIAQSPGIGMTLNGKDLSFSFDKKSMSISTFSSLVDTSFELSDQGFEFYIKHKDFSGNISIFASNVTTYESFSNDIFSVMMGQNLSNFTNWSVIQISTPVTIQASVNSRGFGLSISKSKGPSCTSVYLSNFQNSLSMGFNSTFMIYNSILSGGLSLYSSSASSTLNANLEFPVLSGTAGINLTTSPSIGFSFSNNLLEFNGQISNGGWSTGTSLFWNFGSLTLNGNLQLQNLCDKIGGAISLNVSGTL
ncbi:DUF2460 domain-containing protein [Athalassotoga saccharophila]|uniref:DUF2460 domain-containing protein n=1 Tax=Athalassotoga saccharophila TaxID=1441386 RepID=UPI0013794BEE|nr:DUF2460 domain-containing protein [Athalassotoga saccharophila]BBJ28486.1 hypothetical protein ATHSA_1400 [Athalassotoga saccharophila]